MNGLRPELILINDYMNLFPDKVDSLVNEIKIMPNVIEKKPLISDDIKIQQRSQYGRVIFNQAILPKRKRRK